MALKSKGGEEEDEDLFPPLREIIMRLKQGPMGFGVYQSGDKDKPVVLSAHKRKNPEVLGRQAKKAAGTPKGTFGTLTLDEGNLTFQCMNEDAPASLGKKIRIMLRDEGYAKFKVRILLPGGVELGETDDEDEALAEAGGGGKAPAGAPPEEQDDLLAQLREQLKTEFQALSERIDAAAAEIAPPVLRKIEGLRGMFADTIDPDPRKAGGIVTMLGKMLEAAGLGTGDSPPEPSGRERRAPALAELEKGIDALLAAYS